MKSTIIILFLIYSAFCFSADYTLYAMDFFPAHFFNTKTNSVDGIIIQIIREAYAESGKTVEFKLLPIRRCLNELSKSNVLGCATIPVSKNSNYKNVLIGKESVRIRDSSLYLVSLKDLFPNYIGKFDYRLLKNKSVALFKSDDNYYANRLKKLEAKIDSVMDDMVVAKLLINRRNDFGLMYQQSYEALPKVFKDKIIILDQFDLVKGFVAFNPKHHDAKQAIIDLDNGLVKLKKKKRNIEILKEWINKRRE